MREVAREMSIVRCRRHVPKDVLCIHEERGVGVALFEILQVGS